MNKKIKGRCEQSKIATRAKKRERRPVISFDAYMQSSEWLKQREFHSEAAAAAADPTFRAKNDDDPLNDYFHNQQYFVRSPIQPVFLKGIFMIVNLSRVRSHTLS